MRTMRTVTGYISGSYTAENTDGSTVGAYLSTLELFVGTTAPPRKTEEPWTPCRFFFFVHPETVVHNPAQPHFFI